MFRARRQICEALKAIYGDTLKAVYDKSSGTAPYKAGLELVDGYLYRSEGFSDDEQTVLENGHKFIVNWTEGQKTGFFLDQRENRALVGKMAAGRCVLNLFCYTGGFSIYALAGGALHVDSVDSSAKALSLVDKNVALNGFDASMNDSYCTDAIDFLRNSPEDKYDLIIVDPPAFAKHRGALGNALRAYQRLNAAAIAKVAPGGLVFCFSCSTKVPCPFDSWSGSGVVTSADRDDAASRKLRRRRLFFLRIIAVVFYALLLALRLPRQMK
jgi:23S rRNA (cytosine1962-C5)-methyltransferase